MSAPIPARSTRSPGEPSRLPSFISEMAVIALGGAVGASLRHTITLAVRVTHWHPVLGAVLANLVGSFLLGLLVGALESAKLHPLLRPFLTIGVFGSFTTFSALALDNRALANESGETLAAVHLAVAIVSGLLAFVLGDHLSGSRSSRGEQ